MQPGVDIYKKGARGHRVVTGSEELLPQAKGHIYNDWREGNGNNDSAHKKLHLWDHLRIKLGEACLKYFCHCTELVLRVRTPTTRTTTTTATSFTKWEVY